MGDQIVNWAMEEALSYLFQAMDDGTGDCVVCAEGLEVHSYAQADRCFTTLESES